MPDRSKKAPASVPSYRSLARELGLSHNAVKLALKGQPGLSSDTRRRVLRLARQHGYPAPSFADVPLVVAYLPEGAPWAAAARLMGEFLVEQDLDIEWHETLPAAEILRQADALLYFSRDQGPLAALDTEAPGLPVVAFFEPVALGQADVFLFEGVSGWDDPLLKRPRQFLRQEHLRQIARRIRDRREKPGGSTWECTFHAPRAKTPSARFAGTPLERPGKPSKKPTLAEIAARVGVGATTVALAVQGRRTISDATCRRVIGVAWRMGYRHFKRNRSGDLIVFDQWPLNPHHIFNRFCSILKEVAQQGGDEGAPISHISTLEPDFIRRCIHNLRPDGAILFYDRQDLIEEAARAADPVICPTVSLISEGHSYGMDSVKENNVRGMDMLVRHFQDLGCRRFGFVGTEYTTGTAHLERLATFRATTCAARLKVLPAWVRLFPEEAVRTWGHNPIDWYPAIRADIEQALACGGERPDALLCYNDEYAFIVATVLRDLGLEGIRLGGWGNRSLLQRSPMPVASIELGLRGIASAALSLIAMRTEEPFAPLQTILVNNRLVLP